MGTPNVTVEDCTKSRLRGSPGQLCTQRDHLWGYGCGALEEKFRAVGFQCTRYPQSILEADAKRFIGPPTFRTLHLMKAGLLKQLWRNVVSMEGRLRCVKPDRPQTPQSGRRHERKREHQTMERAAAEQGPDASFAAFDVALPLPVPLAGTR